MKNERLITDKSLLKALNPPLLQAFVMGVRWLRAIASFILLKTKKGRDFYITFPNLSNPNIAPIARTPMNIFLGVNIVVVVCLLLVFLFPEPLSVPIGIALPPVEYGSIIWEPLPPKGTRIPPFVCMKFGGSLLTLLTIIVPSTISPFLNDCLKGIYGQGGFEEAQEGAGETPLKLVVKIYFAIMFFYLMRSLKIIVLEKGKAWTFARYITPFIKSLETPRNSWLSGSPPLFIISAYFCNFGSIIENRTPCTIMATVKMEPKPMNIFDVFDIFLKFKVKLKTNVQNIFDFYKFYAIRWFTTFYKFEKFAAQGLFVFNKIKFPITFCRLAKVAI